MTSDFNRVDEAKRRVCDLFDDLSREPDLGPTFVIALVERLEVHTSRRRKQLTQLDTDDFPRLVQ